MSGCLACSGKGFPQFVFGAFQDPSLSLRKIFPSAVDVKIQHGHRRLIRCAFASFAPLGRTFQRQRNAMRIFPFEDIRLKIQRVATLCYLGRPAASFPPSCALGWLLRSCLHGCRSRPTTPNAQRPIQIAERWMLDVGCWAFSSASKESDNCACRWNIITPLRPCALR